MKSSLQFIGLATALFSFASALEPTSTYTSTIYKTTTVVRSTCPGNVVPCTLSATPFTFSYSYAVSTSVASEPTPVVEYARYTVPTNGSTIYSLVPTTTITPSSDSSTVTLHVTSTTTVSGSISTITLPGGPYSNMTATMTYPTLATSSETSTSSCTETYGFSSGLFSFGASSDYSSYSPSTSSRSYSSTTYIIVTKTIPYTAPGSTETDTIPYPTPGSGTSSSGATGTVGTVGTVTPYLPTDVPQAYVPNAATSISTGLTLSTLMGAIAVGAFVFA